jgi:uncharacterized protein YegP (UPF0339 family)
MLHEDYLPCSSYENQGNVENGIVKFQHSESKLFFFAILDEDAHTLLKSEGYPQEAARDNGLESVLRNRANKDFYSLKNENGQYFLSLRAANYREIARSCDCATEAEANGLISYLTGEEKRGGTLASSATSERESNKVDDDYLPCDEYFGHSPVDGHPGFTTFKSERTGLNYFAVVDEDGTVLFRSEGYPTTSARDNGIESVEKNSKLEERYSVKMLPDGKYVVSIKAGNHQEIARSCRFDSEAEARLLFPSERARIQAEKAAALAATATPSVEVKKEIDRVEDNYLPCKSYEGHTVDSKFPGFVTFTHENGQHYFAMVSHDGKVILRSEGYTTEAARNNGIDSVMRNRDLPGRWSTIDFSGWYFRILKAGNHQEIGRSCPYKTAADAETPYLLAAPVAMAAAIKSVPVEDDYLSCREYEGRAMSSKYPNYSVFKHDNGQYYFAKLNDQGKIVLRGEGFETIEEVENDINRVEAAWGIQSQWSVIEFAGYKMNVLKTADGEEIGRSCPEKPVVEAPIPVAAPAPVIEKQVDKEDDYLICEEYKNKTVNDKVNNVALFKHENGLFYFVLYNSDGSVRLRSEGFVDAKTRDEELSGVLRYKDNSEMYTIIERNGYKIKVLKDKTGREVGRSCLEKDAPVVPVAPIVAAAAPIIAAAIPEVVKVVDKEDDYMPCEDYRGKTVTDKKNNVALFKHKNGLYYFVVYNSNGSVRLRSEGFSDLKKRDSELKAVLQHLDRSNMYTSIEKNGYIIKVLKDETGREVGRSCLEKIPVAAPVVAPPPPVYTAPVVEAAAKGGFNWWWLLPLLLIPLFFLWKGCDKKEVVVETPPITVDTVKAEIPVTPPAPVAACNCSGNDYAIFNIPSGAVGKKLSRLGTNPEFGNSHGLSPEEFYKKLSKRHSSNNVDKEFLDGLFKAMGYANGFSDAKSEMFTEVIIPENTAGNLGYGKNHGTGYYTLPDAERDRKAFKIASNGKCDIHFMKTCGNHFFYCSE